MAISRLGLVKTTLIDYPGEVAATLFLPGCNLRCPYCHNPELVEPPFAGDLLDYEDVRSFLIKRAPLLGGVCITGGEPLIHEDLYDLAAFCRELGLKVKLDTNGTLPGRLDCTAFDFISMDIKTVPEKYWLLVPGDQSPDPSLADNIRRSIEKISEAGVQHEFRTTVVPGIVDGTDMEHIADLIGGIGGNRRGAYILTQFRPQITLNPELSSIPPYPERFLHETAALFERRGVACRVRSTSAVLQAS